jgi:hypothetical protein
VKRDQFELQLTEDIAGFINDPLGYVLYAFPWGEPGTDLEDMDGPDAWQCEQMEAIAAKFDEDPEASIQDATASGHGIGKSAETAWLILWAMSTRPHLNGIITANTASQLTTKTWRELAVWHKRAINKHWFNWTATKFHHVDHAETWFTAAVPNSEHNSEAFAGQHAKHVLIIYDEASGIPDIIWEVSEGAMTTAGAMWFVFGNPTRNEGRFRQCFSKFRHRWHTRQVDSRSAKMTDKRKIQQWLEDYGEDSDFFRVRVRGEFPRVSDTQFISGDSVTEAQDRDLLPAVFANYPKVMGVDVARFGSDQSVITLRQGPKVHWQMAFRELDTMELSSKVRDLYLKEGNVSAVCVDAPGVGAGVVDRLNQFKMPVVEVQPAGTSPAANDYINMRAWMYGQLKEWLKTGDLPAGDRELVDDLSAMNFGYDNKLRIQLESKKDMKSRGLASPDKGDSLAITFHPIDEVLIPAVETIINARKRAGGRRGNWKAYT